MIKNIDDLCKNLENLRQEYIFCYIQFEQLKKNFIPQEEFRIPLADLKTKLSYFQKQIDELERQI